MFQPGKPIKSLRHQEKNCSESLTIMCWNVAKLTLNTTYKKYIKSIIENEKLDILLLQEVKKQITQELDICDYSYVLSPNIQTRQHIFGVLSAFKISCEDVVPLLTKKRELAYMTRKSTLITQHEISHNKKLLIVNLHAINFVKNSDFFHELNAIEQKIKSHKGPMIVAGDFNTWNVQRVRFLKEFSDHLSLKKVCFEDDPNLKRVFSNSLDHIFYRDLELMDSKVMDSKKISDHNPIIATFNLNNAIEL